MTDLIVFDVLDNNMNKDEKKAFIQKVIALSPYNKADLASKLLNMSEKAFDKKMEKGDKGFDNTEFKQILSYAAKTEIWNEFGFKYTTASVLDALKVIIDFSCMPLSKISDLLDIPIHRVHRYKKIEEGSVNNDDVYKFLQFAKICRLDITITY